jgi:hypothetical protein
MSNEYFLEQEFNNYVNSDDFQYYIKNKIQESEYHKYSMIAPEGFVLIPEKILQDLYDFEIWKEFKNNPDFIKQKTLEIVQSSKFKGEH